MIPNSPPHCPYNPTPTLHLTNNSRRRLRLRWKEGIRLTRSSWARTRQKCTKPPAASQTTFLRKKCLFSPFHCCLENCHVEEIKYRLPKGVVEVCPPICYPNCVRSVALGYNKQMKCLAKLTRYSNKVTLFFTLQKLLTCITLWLNWITIWISKE